MRTLSRKLWTVVIILLLGLFCTIRDDNGNPNDPGIDSQPLPPVDVDIVPSLFASPERASVRPGDTLGIRVRVFTDSAGPDSLRPLVAFPVIASSNRGCIIVDTLYTDSNGRVLFQFTDTSSGSVEFTVTGNDVRQTIRFEVTETPIQIQKLLQALPGKSIIKADGVDTTTIAVSVLNSFRNPIIGECVQFITSAGTIAGNGSGCENSGQSVTGPDGIARALLISSNINDTAFITAYLVSDQSLNDEVEVVFQGMAITISSDKNKLKTGDTAVIVAKVINASDQPVAKTPIYFSLEKGSGSNLSIISVDSITNYEGSAVFRIAAERNGTDVITISAAGTKASLQINVSSLSLNLELDKTILQTSNTDTARVTATFTNANGTPLGNRTVKLNRYFKTAEDADTADVISATTTSSGKCTFPIIALTWEGTMRLNVIGFDNTEGAYASTDTVLQFITTRVMTIRPPQPIPADGVSKGAVMVFIKNKSGNPVVGDFIAFTTTAGTIASQSKTNEDGKAEAFLISDRRNIIATITATLVSDPTKKQTTTVAFKGVELFAAANPPSIRSNRKDTALVIISLMDAAKLPISGEWINISKQQDFTIIAAADSVTNNDGEARCKIAGSGSGSDTLRISAAGASASVIINYSSNILRIDTAAGQACIADSSDSTLVVATYLKGDSSTTISNASVDICATVGKMDTIFARKFTTDANGKIAFYIRNPHFAVTATIFGIARVGDEITSASFPLYFKANIVHRIDISGSPEVISINGNRAKISATAYDSANNRVKDARLSFNLVNGPSGGEYLDPPIGLTGDDGTATTYLISGKTPSQYRQVWIVAGSFSSVKSDTVKFTISGPPQHITIRRNIIKGENPNDGTFLLPCAAIVTDVNGNPVADETEVNFSLQISGYATHRIYAHWTDSWSWADSSYHCDFRADTAVDILSFEDFNNNFILDPGEDRNKDGNLNRGENLNGDYERGKDKWNPGIGFLDINDDGIRQYNQQGFSISRTYAPAEDLHPCGRGYVIGDLNKNAQWDPIEPLLDKAGIYLSTYQRLRGRDALWYHYMGNDSMLSTQDFADLATLEQMDIAYRDSGPYDIDYRFNGVCDPQTAVSIIRTVRTKDGKALNKILYGQSDAGYIEIMVWAESQGVVTESPEQLILPIVKDEE